MENLKACPFCGGGAELDEIGEELADAECMLNRYYVGCNVCGAIGPDELTEAEAIAAWNRRV